MLTNLWRWLFSVRTPVKLVPTPPDPRLMVLKRLNPKNYVLTHLVQENLEKTASLYLEICKLVGNTPKINSGYRSQDEQTILYQRMGKKPKLGSAHIIGSAMDLSDVDGKLFELLSRPENLMKLGIYLEDKASTPAWVHVQHIPPHSGKRVFKP